MPRDTQELAKKGELLSFVDKDTQEVALSGGVPVNW